MRIREFSPKFKPVPYIPGEVILVGLAQHIEQVLGHFSKTQDILPPLSSRTDTFQLGNVRALIDCANLEPTEILAKLLKRTDCLAAEPWIAQLIQFPPELPPEDVVAQIHEFAQRKNLCVWAGPNYLVGHPHTLAGSPHTTLGKPADPRHFARQWAFQHIGTAPAHVPSACTGQRVQIGVFDSSPFSESGKHYIDYICPHLELEVRHLAAFSQFGIPEELRPLFPPCSSDLSDHGLAVCGLAHSVAHTSDIVLYRVLDPCLLGTLFVLAWALVDFINDASAETAEYIGRVINLSLGVARTAACDPDILLLELVLSMAFCKGIVIAAAAGNKHDPADPDAPEFPASYPHTMAVASSNHANQPSCFTKQGQISAPGGDGLGGGCAPASGGSDAEQETCGLISIVTKKPAYPSGYAYCSGTSFATPLVAGQAALILEKLSTSAVTLPGPVPVHVFNNISGTASALNIINVPNSLA